VRVEWRGEVWVVSGDYKTDTDQTCEPFEPVPCHTFITEATFGVPVYRWPRPPDVFRDITNWWRENAAHEAIHVWTAWFHSSFPPAKTATVARRVADCCAPSC